MLGLHIADFTNADTMLAGAGAAHGERAVDHVVVDPLGPRELLFIARLEQESDMKIAVAGMADDGRQQTAFIDLALGLEQTFGEA